MKHFGLVDFNVEKASIESVIHVPPRMGDSIHRNRPTYGLVFTRDAVLTFHFEDGTVMEALPNSGIFVPKGANYTSQGTDTEQWRVGTYAFNFHVEKELDIGPFLFRPQNPEKVFNSFREAEITWKMKAVGYYEKSCRNFYDVVLGIKREMADEYMAVSKRYVIAPALSYINENYTHENIKTGRLAALCGISEVYMRKIFQQEVGTSPVKYINRLKLLRAKELIESGEYSVGAAALQSGFFDDSYFSREFKKEFGISPANYAKIKERPI